MDSKTHSRGKLPEYFLPILLPELQSVSTDVTEGPAVIYIYDGLWEVVVPESYMYPF